MTVAKFASKPAIAMATTGGRMRTQLVQFAHLLWTALASVAALLMLAVMLAPTGTLRFGERLLRWLESHARLPGTVAAVVDALNVSAGHLSARVVVIIVAAAALLLLVRSALRHFALFCAWGRAHRLSLKRSPEANWDQGLLPSQRAYVEEFLHELLMRPHDIYSAKILAVRGVWGSGKTTVVQAMRRALTQPPSSWGVKATSGATENLSFIPAYMNAWRDENPEDLHGRLVERVMLVPEVLRAVGWMATGVSSRFLWSLSKPNNREVRRTNWGRVKASFSQKLADAEAKAEVELQGQPTRLTFQEDLEVIVCAIRRSGQHLVLFVDELDRGTPKAAQAMLVMLRRSLDLQGVHLVVPYVAEVLNELAFNPLHQESAELVAASQSVLAAADTMGRTEQTDLHNISLKAFTAAATHTDKRAVARMSKAPDAQADKSVVKTTGVAAEHSRPGEAMRNKRREILHDRMLSGFLGLNRQTREVLQRRMSEKYIGFERALPRARPEDLCSFVWSMVWLRNENRLGGFFTDVLTGSLKLSLADAAQAAQNHINSAPNDERPWRAAADELRFLLDPNDAPLWPALEPGAFSWRSFESYVQLMLQQHVKVKEWPDFGPRGQDDQAIDETLAAALAHFILAALTLFSFEQGLPPRS